ncbi:hypothetical protein [Escherichia coli]|uniref:hypothetical protein n=1 Tax=Escherichia coli TaxID=562 RepID=UPI0012A972E6|nr:hypothetical protein [Escherichia coli]QGK01701.1 hypothetical protein GJD97_22410 [Escherichia coli]
MKKTIAMSCLLNRNGAAVTVDYLDDGCPISRSPDMDGRWVQTDDNQCRSSAASTASMLCSKA